MAVSRPTSHRGVWRISWGATCPAVLLVINGQNQLVTDPILLLAGIAPEPITARLWDVLDAADPNPSRSTGTPAVVCAYAPH